MEGISSLIVDLESTVEPVGASDAVGGAVCVGVVVVAMLYSSAAN